MRPLVPDAVPDRPRKLSTGDAPSTAPFAEHPNASSSAVESFFLTKDYDYNGEEEEEGDTATESQPSASDTIKDSTYGVQSLEETINETATPPETKQTTESVPENPSDHQPPPHHDHTSPHQPPSRPRNIEVERLAHSPARSAKNPIRATIPTSITPSILGSPAEPVSFPSSPKSTSTQSLRRSDDLSLADEARSQAIASDDDDEEEDEEDGQSASQSQTQSSDPQLIMPSIRMPSRRPFTDRGRVMGRLKVLIAGAPGSGKTSLLEAIVQQSRDIVHADPLPRQSSANPPKTKQSERKSKRKTRDIPPISEVYASTKPYPSWWSDLEDSRVLRRRKSSGDVVLERNLCFVDSCGGPRSREAQTDLLMRYMTQQLSRARTAIQTANSDLQGLLSGNGGSQVDAILFLISQDTVSADIECIRKLSRFTNVIPLISKADTLTQDEVGELKRSFLNKAGDAGIQPFLFGQVSPESATDSSGPSVPFAVSSVHTSDSEVMEASVLMSSGYVQPLASSELEALVEKMFDQDNLSWLRHSAAKKLTQSSTAGMGNTTSILSRAAFTPRGRRVNAASYNSTNYSLARVPDNTQAREESSAPFHLAKWASDLQRSLENERKRYESLASQERAVWLTERLGECVVDGTLIPLSETPGFRKFKDPSRTSTSSPAGDGERGAAGGGVLTFQGRDGRRVKYRVDDTSSQDPLGLIRWNEEVRRRGWILVQVVGGVGVVGGLALWMARVWGLSPQNSSEWTLAWLGGSS